MGKVKAREQARIEREQDRIIEAMIKGEATKEQEERFMSEVFKEAKIQEGRQRRQDFMYGGIFTSTLILILTYVFGG